MDPISISLLLLLVAPHFAVAAAANDTLFTNPCNELCGDLSLPYPFHLNSSCGPQIDAFRLTCANNSSLFLTLGLSDLRIISFLTSSSILIDYSSKSKSNSSPCDHWYADLDDSAGMLNRSSFVAVTPDNVLRLYDCDDSSVCRSGCERVGGCEGGGGVHQGCCYPLSDGSVWKAGDGFGVFGEYGCRSFSSWVEKRGLDGHARRGIEVEWAVPMRLVEDAACAEGAVMVNATVVKKGYRCACGPGLVGDGFAQGIGCFKACGDDGRSANDDRCKGRFCEKRVAIIIGAIISAIFITCALAICFLAKGSVNGRSNDHPHQACLPKILGRACRTRLFTYQELDDATKGFGHEQKLTGVVDGTIHTGVIDDGSLVAVQKLSFEKEENLRRVCEIVENLSQASHKNIARIIGCCISSTHSLLLVHEFFSHGTLEEHLQLRRGHGLSWCHRINIAIEVASALSFLQSEISPPVHLIGLKSSEIFIDAGYSIKIASFEFPSSTVGHESCSYAAPHDAQTAYNFGLLLLELITGSRKEHLLEFILLKIKDRGLREIADPYLRFDDQPRVQCEQMESTAVFAAQCLGRGAGQSVSMVAVAKDFIRITHEGVEDGGKTGPVLEATFSNSSLLQMISMSPDAIHVP